MGIFLQLIQRAQNSPFMQAAFFTSSRSQNSNLVNFKPSSRNLRAASETP